MVRFLRRDRGMTPAPTPASPDARQASQAARGSFSGAPTLHAGPSIRRRACLRLRLASSQCSACADACPTQALRLGVQRLELCGPCTGCGRCQAVCPNAALAVDGFDAGPVQPPRGPLTVECQRAPAGTGTLRLPCLGGLSAARLLGLCAAAPETRVLLIDRGDCGTCPSGGGGSHPARALLERVDGWLAEAGVPAPLRPVLVAPQSAADPLQPHGRARRGFFAALAAPPPAPRPRASAIARREASNPRRQIVAALRTLAARHGGRVAAMPFHRLHAGPACEGHRVCAAACPTGALTRWRDDEANRQGIAFDDELCIGCGHCVDLCPGRALRLERDARQEPAGRHALSRFEQRACIDCGARFAVREGDEPTRCSRCRKSAGLARSAFQSLFVPRA
jgi:ferredoxin